MDWLRWLFCRKKKHHRCRRKKDEVVVTFPDVVADHTLSVTFKRKKRGRK